MRLNQAGIFSSGKASSVLALFSTRAVGNLSTVRTTWAQQPYVSFDCKIFSSKIQYLVNWSTTQFIGVKVGAVVIQAESAPAPVEISCPDLTAENWHNVEISIDTTGLCFVRIDEQLQNTANLGGVAIQFRRFLGGGVIPGGNETFVGFVKNLRWGTVFQPFLHYWVNRDPNSTILKDLGTNTIKRDITLTGEYEWEPIGLSLSSARAMYSSYDTNLDINPSDTVVLQAFVKVSGTTQQYIFDGPQADPSGGGWKVSVGAMRVKVNNNTGSILTCTDLTENTWHYVRVEISTTQIRAYVDNILQSSLAIAVSGFRLRHIFTSNGNISIGAFGGNIQGLTIGTLSNSNQYKYKNLDTSEVTWQDVGTIGGRTIALNGTYNWESIL